MKTLLLSEDDDNAINLVCELLKKGEVVGVPTETVYGLAGDCTNSNAIKKIFLAKGRPQDNPLIVHISNLNMLNGIVSEFSNDSQKLANAFWPGPLTMIMPKGCKVCSESCANLNSVGVRMPKNKTARKIIEKSGIPFSAPSANLSGKPSPTNAQDVYEDMNGRIELIIDGGECERGVESTVISMIEETPIILRPGVITKEEIERVLGKSIKISSAVINPIKAGEKILSPGMKYKHYAPNADVVLVKSSLTDFVKYTNQIEDENTVVICFNGEEDLINLQCLTYGKIDDENEQAKEIFSVLRKVDKIGANKVYVRCPKESGIALAVYNRLIRSAGFKVLTL